MNYKLNNWNVKGRKNLAKISLSADLIRFNFSLKCYFKISQKSKLLSILLYSQFYFFPKFSDLIQNRL